VASAIGGAHGGGSVLTELGHELVDVYRRIEATATRACAKDLGRLLELVAPVKATSRSKGKKPSSGRAPR